MEVPVTSQEGGRGALGGLKHPARRDTQSMLFDWGRTEDQSLSEVREEHSSLERSDLPREEMLVLICVLIWG